MAVGNHEFDDGDEGLAKLANGVDFPVISGNIDVSASNILADIVDDHTILEVGGKKIGIISALAADTVVGNVPVVQAYAYSKYVGHLELTFDDAGNVTAATGDTILLDASVAEDAAIVARVSELAGPIEEMKTRVVAEAAEPIEGAREVCRAMECAMGNLVADAMLDRVSDQGIQIAIQNGGGLRSSIDAGEITMGEVLSVLPFQNTLSTFEVTGEAIVAALENGASQIEEGAGRFAQVAGMSYAIDASAAAGSRVSDVMVDGAPIDLAATYGVVSNNVWTDGADFAA